MLLFKLLDLCSVLHLQPAQLVSGGLSETCSKHSDFVIVSSLGSLLFLTVFFSDLGKNTVVLFLHSFELRFEFAHCLVLLLHQLFLLVSKLCLEVHKFLLQLSYSPLQLHLDEFLIVASVAPQLLEHAFVLFFERLHLTAVLIRKTLLHTIELLFGLDAELIECLSNFLELLP